MAEIDLAESMDWYALQSPRLDADFLEEAERTFKKLSGKPFLYAIHHNRKTIQLRTAAMDRFPFLVVFFVDPKRNLVIIIAVWHTSRDPKAWKKRTL